MNEQLIAWAKEGYAPTLLYDDNGHWAVSFDGIMSVDSPAEQSFYTGGNELTWRDTPQEAVDAMVGKEDD